MRICLVCGEYPPGPHGGIGTVTQVIARALVREGHHVRVVGTCAAAYPGPDREDDQGVDVWRLREAPHRLGWIATRWRLFATIAGWSRRGEIDLVEVPDYAGAAAGWPPLPVPLVARVHGSVSYFAAELGEHLGSRTFRVERASLRRADAWCAVSRYAAEKTQRLLGLDRAPSAILYNPVELPTGDHGPRSRHRVVFAGTLAVKKGIVPLVDAWPHVRARCPDAELHVCGKDGRTAAGGSMREELQARLGGHAASVHFHGHLPRAEVLRMLGSARAVVLPSFAEAFAMAPLEAMACGAPTIYSRRGSGTEIIEDGRTGLLVEPDHTSEIVDAITLLLDDDALAGRLGAAGREHVERHFGVAAVITQNVAFYERCVHDFTHARVPQRTWLQSLRSS